MPDLSSPVLVSGCLRDRVQPTITLDELVIRPFRPEDAPAVLNAYRDPAIQQWHVRTIEDIKEANALVARWSDQWAAETGAGWAVTHDGVLVGRVGFRSIVLPEAAAELAYWTIPAARGRGVAARSASALTAWMFVHVGLHRVELNHSALNTISCRVAEKAGFTFEGLRRQQGLHRDGWHDMHIHARLATDARLTDRPSGGR